MSDTTKIIKAINELPEEQGGRCRDCADDGPFCPNRGMPCGIHVDDLKALAAELARHREALANARTGLDYAFSALMLAQQHITDIESRRHIETAYLQVKRTLGVLAEIDKLLKEGDE